MIKFGSVLRTTDPKNPRKVIFRKSKNFEKCADIRQLYLAYESMLLDFYPLGFPVLWRLELFLWFLLVLVVVELLVLLLVCCRNGTEAYPTPEERAAATKEWLKPCLIRLATEFVAVCVIFCPCCCWVPWADKLWILCCCCDCHWNDKKPIWKSQ